MSKAHHSTAHRAANSAKSITAKRAALTTDIDSLQAMLVKRDLMVEKLKLQIARMKRVRFGASSEQLDTHLATRIKRRGFGEHLGSTRRDRPTHTGHRRQWRKRSWDAIDIRSCLRRSRLARTPAARTRAA
jgi:hypothetical protein